MEEFVKRIFCAIFEDEINLCINFKGKGNVMATYKSKFYEVLVGVSPFNYLTVYA